MLTCFVDHAENAIPISIITPDTFNQWQTDQAEFIQSWLQSTQYKGDAGNISIIPDVKGKISRVLICINEVKNFWGIGTLPLFLPAGVYKLDSNSEHLEKYIMAWGLGSYQFSRYKKPLKKPAQLLVPKNPEINNLIESIYLVRDLINTPTDDMGPTELAEAFAKLGKDHQAIVKQIIGDDLLTENYSSIHTVGRASDDAPRLLDLRWGNPAHPKVTLVGKGVCFDSGGLDIKPASGMLLMKKDMGGAAHVMGLARMIMTAQLPVCLRVLIPAVENVISGNAYRPGDVIKSRKGLTIEITNTDAEGRVVLADALAEAVSEKPDLLIDISTLTGAARVALGTELPAMFCNNDEVAKTLSEHAEKELDPLWRLPLFMLYRDALLSSIADLSNSSADGYAGAITAGLFLKEFVPDTIPWLHFDLMAWNLKTRPGRPQGGEAMGLRALFSYIKAKF
jgi:leucyl aminopeptidase